jgi:hypothetical protein
MHDDTALLAPLFRKLYARGWQVRAHGNGWWARCQAEGDDVEAANLAQLEVTCDLHDAAAHLPRPAGS